MKSVSIPDSVTRLNEEDYQYSYSCVFHRDTVVILNHYIKDIEKKKVAERLVFCKTPIQEIKSTNAKELAVKGFLTVEDLAVYDEDVVASYKKYLKSKTINYAYFIQENDTETIVRRLASLNLLDSKFVDKMMESDPSDEIKALLENAKTDSKKGGVKKSSANKEPTITELKKTWSFKKNEDGITITSYKGFDTKVVIPEMIGKDAVTEVGAETFSAWKRGLNDRMVRARRSITEITIPATVGSIGYDAFKGCSNLSSIVIPDGVTSIGGGAFAHCSCLTGISIPAGVTSIGYETFTGCSSLISISIPDSVTDMGSHAFNKCSSLKHITLPYSLKEMGYDLFARCSSLESIIIPDSVTEIKSDVFNGCTSLKSVTIPDSVTSIGHSAFAGCSSLMSICLPKGVEEIRGYAFSNCSSMLDITVLGNATTIGQNAFFNSDNLTIHAPAGSLAEEFANKNGIPFERLEQ